MEEKDSPQKRQNAKTIFCEFKTSVYLIKSNVRYSNILPFREQVFLILGLVRWRILITLNRIVNGTYFFLGITKNLPK
jgi:hypothetical protein